MRGGRDSAHPSRGHTVPLPVDVTNYISLVSPQAAKARSFRCSSSPQKVYDFLGTPVIFPDFSLSAVPDTGDNTPAL